MNREMMNCSEVQELLSAYYDGELADERRIRLSDHLDDCSQCAQELVRFESLTHMAGTLNTPAPPPGIWSRLQRQLDQQPSSRPVAGPAGQMRRWPMVALQRLALAATVLVAVGIGWSTYQSWLAHGEHSQFTAEFGNYLDAFRRDPAAAQQILLANYENQSVDPRQAIRRVGYRPVVADGLPEEYTLVSTHVMTMPCCTCVQSVCQRGDGSTLAIFEHDDEETTEWFGEKPGLTAKCRGKECCLVDLDDQIAASWKQGSRQITLVGVRDIAEINELVAWMDDKQSVLQ